MPIVDFSLDLNPVERLLYGLSERAQDLRPAWRVIHQDFLQVEKAQFESEGGYSGLSWPALSTRYAAWKAKHYPGRKLLVQTGRLQSSLTTVNSDHRFISLPQEVTMGTGVQYAGFHESGTRRMPSRPPVRLSSRERTRWPEVVREYISRFLQGAD